ncbi:alkaline phosphatase family protein [Frigoribacterium sp. VKM Ac-1396]|uniref:alkaline phosphatase family protein n=1 Tax=Frigoribacterium sp. VKM Ac-1396 TaxID=2783821 RepID=UPI00351C43C4
MSSIVPARPRGAASLADVVPSCLASLRGEVNVLGLPAVRAAVVVVVDGLGQAALGARRGHARTLSGVKGSLWSGWPTTTAAALTTLTTGALPGQHGLVGYSVLDAENDRVVKQLSGWDDRMRPDEWQRRPTLFETATDVESHAVGPKRYRSSGLTEAILRGATYDVAESVADRFATAAQLVESGRASLIYLYVPELDMIAHRAGWESDEWIDALEGVDSEVRSLEAGLPPDVGVIVTADHGMVDVGERRRIVFGGTPALVDGVRHVAGEPRCLQLHLEPDAGDGRRRALLESWRSAEGDRAWVLTREEAVDAGWFGPVDPVVVPRIGDVLVAARRGVAYYDGRDRGGEPGTMVGQHGSWSDDETMVPLRAFGAYRRQPAR